MDKEIKVVSHNSDGELKILVKRTGKEDKAYTYYGLSPHHLKQVKAMIKDGGFGRIFQFLKPFGLEKKVNKNEG